MLLDFDKLYEKYNMKINGVIQIGAHYGQEHHIYKNKGVEKIVYFEPLKKNFEILNNNVGKDSICFNMALGNENRDVEMFVESANNGMSSSVLKPDLHTQQYPHITFDSKELVKMSKLDDVDFDFSNHNFINIDVQGYEIEVFKGSTNILKNIDYIISEVNRESLYENCTMVWALDEFLSEYGFERVETEWIGGNWGDALYVKKSND